MPARHAAKFCWYLHGASLSAAHKELILLCVGYLPRKLGSKANERDVMGGKSGVNPCGRVMISQAIAHRRDRSQPALGSVENGNQKENFKND